MQIFCIYTMQKDIIIQHIHMYYYLLCIIYSQLHIKAKTLFELT
jgi:hypothetical protein